MRVHPCARIIQQASRHLGTRLTISVSLLSWPPQVLLFDACLELLSVTGDHAVRGVRDAAKRAWHALCIQCAVSHSHSHSQGQGRGRGQGQGPQVHKITLSSGSLACA
jgi:hypothetical protein